MRVFHTERQLRCLVHGDDYATSGNLDNLLWMRDQLDDKFEMKNTLIGHSSATGVAKEGKILNRVVRAVAGGWEFECDQRRV